jgi:hypothetical protein
MMPPLSTKTAALILLLTNSSAFAQTADQPAAASAAQIAAPVSEPAATAGAGAASASEETAIIFGPSVDLPSYASDAPADSVSQFLRATTVEPVIRAARYAGEWISSGSDAAVFALQGAGRWVASGSNCVARAAGTMSEWVASGSSAAVFAARNTGDWVSTNSIAAVNLAVDTATSVSSLTIFENWSGNLVKKIENHLRGEGAGAFHHLILESGFALTDVQVGVGIIPDLTVNFRHVRNLTPAESEVIKTKIDAHARAAPGIIGFFEAIVLRRLLKAGQYTGGMRISEVHVSLFPLPDLEVLFDPFSYENDKNQKIAGADSLSKADSQSLKAIEDRVSKIETILPALQNQKN